jgi:hypothetical protein
MQWLATQGRGRARGVAPARRDRETAFQDRRRSNRLRDVRIATAGEAFQLEASICTRRQVIAMPSIRRHDR